MLAVATIGLSTAAILHSTPEPPAGVDAQLVLTPAPVPSVPDRVAIGEAMQRLADPSRSFTMAILGDSTGADADSWPTLVGEWMGAKYDRTVTVYPWNEQKDPVGFTKPRQLAGGANAAITIYNGSAPNRNAAYSLATLDEMIPVDMETVDLVLINHGHNQPTDSLTPQVNALAMKLSEVAPQAAVSMILQNPQRVASSHVVEHTNNTGAMRVYAERFAYETIDVRQAYLDYGDFGSLYKDNVHPGGAKGYRIWADTVISALGGP